MKELPEFESVHEVLEMAAKTFNEPMPPERVVAYRQFLADISDKEIIDVTVRLVRWSDTFPTVAMIYRSTSAGRAKQAY